MLKTFFKAFGLSVIIIICYLYIKPNDVEPLTWVAPEAPELTGMLSSNEELKNIKIAYTGDHWGPEDVAVDSAGFIYVGTGDGFILRFTPDALSYTQFAATGGRPLGLDFDYSGNLIVADADKGLLSIDPSGKITVLTTESDNKAYKFTDDVEVARDGNIYFTDASDKFSVHEYKKDLIEHRPHGRLLCYNPAAQSTTLLLDSLYFANGVALSPEEDFVLVNETSTYRVIRYWINGEKAGKKEIFTENLPGFPDGITLGTEGVFWLTLASPRDKNLDMLAQHPGIRKMIVNLPDALQPKPQKYGLVIGFNSDGDIVKSLHDPDGGFIPITSAEEYNGKLYLGSLTEKAFAFYPLQ